MVSIQSFWRFLFLFVATAWCASMRLPSYPLAVKTPYLSVWMPGHLSHDFPHATPQFWQGQSLTWIILARIDGRSYCLLGCPGDRKGTVPATQKSLNFTSTHTYVNLEAGSTNITLDFFSPVDPEDHVRQSLPYSYVTISADSSNRAEPKIEFLTAIDASWLSTRGRPRANVTSDEGLFYISLNGDQPVDFAEKNEMALWGDVVLATGATSKSSPVSYKVGGTNSVLECFTSSGSLDGTIGNLTGRSVAAIVKRILAEDANAAVTFAVGLHQEHEIQYFDGIRTARWAGYFKSKLSTVKQAVQHLFADFDAASTQSSELDKKIRDMGEVTSSNYADLLEFSVRQSFGGMQVTIPSDTLDTSLPYAFIKEISTDGNVNTLADLIPKALPIFHVLNPEYTRMFIEPVLRFSVKGWPLNHAVHDIGKSYPNATGETPCIEEFLPLDSSTVLLWMVYLYENTTGNKDMSTTYGDMLKTYADYCVHYGLYPVLQRSSMDQVGSATNQSALSISAAIALNAYGKMTGLSNYSDLGIEFGKAILDLGRDSSKTHFLAHYSDQDDSFVIAYPLGFDALLGLDTFPSWVHDMQSQWYSKMSRPFGIQFSSAVPYTLLEFEMWAAATSSHEMCHYVIDTIHKFLDQETEPALSVPGPSQWRVLPGANEGKWTRFSKAKSVIGSLFMVAAVQNRSNGSHVESQARIGSVSQPPVIHGHSVDHQDLKRAAPQNFDLEGGHDIPYYVPDGASKPIDPAFLGLSIDTASFPAYMGNLSSPNLISQDLIRNLIKRSGSALHIRIGSPEADEATYDADQAVAIEQVDDGGATTLSIGPSLFEGIKAFDARTDIYWAYQVPFVGLNISNAVQGTKKALEAVPPTRVSALEIGHSPNLYAGTSRPENYGCQSYAAELFKLEVALRRNIGRVSNQFQALGLSSRQIDNAWTMEECFTVGINAQDTLRSVSVHYSQLESSSDFDHSRLPGHSAVRHRHREILPHAQYVRDIFPCFPFTISEASFISPSAGGHSVSPSSLDSQTSLGIALWNLDFLLYSMSKNVSRVFMHQSCDSLSSAWTPNSCSSKKAIGDSSVGANAPYYALTFVASFVKGAKDFRVIPVHESEDLVVYAGYEAGKFSRMAIVNLSPHGGQDGVSFDVHVPSHITRFHQTAQINDLSLGSEDTSFTGNPQKVVNPHQVPLGGKPLRRFIVKDGLLSVTLRKAQAILLVPQYK